MTYFQPITNHVPLFLLRMCDFHSGKKKKKTDTIGFGHRRNNTIAVSDSLLTSQINSLLKGAVSGQSNTRHDRNNRRNNYSMLLILRMQTV